MNLLLFSFQLWSDKKNIHGKKKFAQSFKITFSLICSDLFRMSDLFSSRKTIFNLVSLAKWFAKIIGSDQVWKLRSDAKNASLKRQLQWRRLIFFILSYAFFASRHVCSQKFIQIFNSEKLFKGFAFIFSKSSFMQWIGMLSISNKIWTNF